MEENKIYTIILSDGSRIENVTINGSTFVSENEIREDMFDGNLTPVIISDGIHMITHTSMELVQITKYNEMEKEKYYFVLRDLSDMELALNKMNSNIQYLSMMTGIDLF